MLPEPIVALTAALAKLPGVGPRSAERVALNFLGRLCGVATLTAH